MKFYRGPDWDNLPQESTIDFFQHKAFKGRKVAFKCHELPNEIKFSDYDFDKKLFSIKFSIKADIHEGNPTGPNDSIGYIPFVVELYRHDSFNGKKVMLVRSENFLFFSDFHNKTSSVKAFKGPSYKDGDKIELYDKTSF